MQIVFQDPFDSLNPRMTVGSILTEPLLVHGVRLDTSTDLKRVSRGEAREKAADLMKLVGLSPEYFSRYPHEFSGGQRQRIGIARALTLGPKFIVCDEAVSALDVSIQAQILNLLQELQDRLDLTYLFIAHDLAVVRHICDRVAVMYLGEIVEEADTSEIFSNPLHPYTQTLLASIPVPVAGQRVRSKAGGDSPSPVEPPSGCRFHPRCPIAIDECKTTRPALIEITPGIEWPATRQELRSRR